MFRYSYGRLETSADEKTIDGLFARFKESGFHFRNLLIALVESPEFLREWNTTSSVRLQPDRGTLQADQRRK
jgi:hypothetical protein